jgi:hypothetical protein
MPGKSFEFLLLFLDFVLFCDRRYDEAESAWVEWPHDEPDQHDIPSSTECNHMRRHMSWMSVDDENARAIVVEYGLELRNMRQKIVLSQSVKRTYVINFRGADWIVESDPDRVSVQQKCFFKCF